MKRDVVVASKIGREQVCEIVTQVQDSGKTRHFARIFPSAVSRQPVSFSRTTCDYSRSTMTSRVGQHRHDLESIQLATRTKYLNP